MPTSRNIPPDAWEHARQALVFYFARRARRSGAEDLAQETLLAVWARKDYEFACTEDFLRVCYGFAGKILLKDRRDTLRGNAGPPVELSGSDGASPPAGESQVFLAEVLRIGSTELRARDWRLIQLSVDNDVEEISKELGLEDPNNRRVRLSRARRKLADMTFWRKRKGRRDKDKV
jgi:hypothetical protein